MATLFLDLETYSELPLQKVGAYRYAEESEILLVPHAMDDEDVVVWDMTVEDNPARRLADLQEKIHRADTVVTHGAFDPVILRQHGVEIPPEKHDDSMALALLHGTAAKLEILCDVFGLAEDEAKDKRGKKLIQLFSKPCPKNWKLERATRLTHPNEWQEFIAYARSDVVSMRDIYRQTPRWNVCRFERDIWLADKETNDRGIAVDLELARSARRAFERATRSLAATCSRLTGGALTSVKSPKAMKDYLNAKFNLGLPDMQAETIEAYLSRDNLDPVAREILSIRQQVAATSPAKFDVLLRAACKDGRVRDLLQYAGAARTARDAGRLFQPQNLPRPTVDEKGAELAVEVLKMDCEDLIFGNVSEVCNNAVRGALTVPEGKKMVVCDLSNIEGRVAAWLAGEETKLKAFRAYDAGEGPDIYMQTYATSMGIPIEVVVDNKKNGDGGMRQIGKVMELALGFQGSVGAFRKMGGSTADTLPDEEILTLVRKWRDAHPNIRGFWYDLERAAKEAICGVEGKTYRVGHVAFDKVRDSRGREWLRIKLPSGRYLSYFNPRVTEPICEKCNGEGRTADGLICRPCAGSGRDGWETITYEGLDTYTKKWKTQDTYGGKLFENIVQAVARDVFMHGMLLCRNAGFAIILRVHDELVAEVPDNGEYTLKWMRDLMETNPPWAKGLPLAATGFEGYRYRKD